MKWKGVHEGTEFSDGSVITQIHERYSIPSYSFTIGDQNVKNPTIIVSQDHYFLCDLSRLDYEFLEDFLETVPRKIPKQSDLHLIRFGGEFATIEEFTDWDDVHFRDNLYWIPAIALYYLISMKKEVWLVSDIRDFERTNEIGDNKLNDAKYIEETKHSKLTFKIDKWMNKTAMGLHKNYKRVPILDANYVGNKECFCISTTTGKYEVCGVVHHNSVTLRNMIFHALTHTDEIKLGLVDLKLSEFSRWKGQNGVVGVANSPQEAVELLRLAREIMYKRNAENAKRGLTDFYDYKPQSPTDRISIFGQEYHEDTEFEVEIGGEIKRMTAKEILEYMES